MRYEEALKIIHFNNWANATIEEKEEALRAIETYVAKEQGRNPVRITFQHTDKDELGAYDFFQSKSITISDSLLENDSSQAAVETVLHEGFHAYQDQLVNGLIEGYHPNAVLWKDSLEGRYISYKQNPRGYEEQALEQDAREYADDRGREIQFEVDYIARKICEKTTSLSQKKDLQNEEQEEKYHAIRKSNSFKMR